MTYYAIGESDGGAGERRLGPFSTPEEAESAGRRETANGNGAFVYKGVVDEANNQVLVEAAPVSTNSVVKNAVAASSKVANNAKYKFGRASKVGKAWTILNNCVEDLKSAQRELYGNGIAEMYRGDVERLIREVAEVARSLYEYV